ncbi:hypothetical protein FOA52_008003 [Chlamydomonas sp. UWO 241]|nr:hypothetical protein FOA52_008003 [Chlamydomonas sp. UWO 241]
MDVHEVLAVVISSRKEAEDNSSARSTASALSGDGNGGGFSNSSSARSSIASRSSMDGRAAEHAERAAARQVSRRMTMPISAPAPITEAAASPFASATSVPVPAASPVAIPGSARRTESSVPLSAFSLQHRMAGLMSGGANGGGGSVGVGGQWVRPAPLGRASSDFSAMAHQPSSLGHASSVGHESFGQGSSGGIGLARGLADFEHFFHIQDPAAAAPPMSPGNSSRD